MSRRRKVRLQVLQPGADRALELLQRLERQLRGGAAQPPARRVARRLEALAQDRFVLPGVWPILPGDSKLGASISPLPMREDWWRKLAYTPIDDMGTKCATANLLSAAGIRTVAALLLHGEREIVALLSKLSDSPAERKAAMKDVRFVLEKNNLRLASDSELADSLSWGFHCVLAGQVGAELRVATFMLSELPMAELRPLFDLDNFWPYEHEGVVTLGRLLGMTPRALDDLWRRSARRYAEEEGDAYTLSISPSERVVSIATTGFAAMTDFLDKNGLSLRLK